MAGPISGRRSGVALAAALLGGLVALLTWADSGGAKPPPIGDGVGNISLSVLGDFDEPVYTATAPGKESKNLVFVVEREGTVRVVRRNEVLDKPFIDVADELKLDFNGTPFNELGLLSIAFDPDYAKNRRFYLYYTSAPDGDIAVTQFQRKRNSAVVANPDSGNEVISIPHSQYPNHNGGQVSFGPDGNMWLATGDGGFACDPDENAQNLDSLLGKLLRIDPKAGGGYSVPKDNPLVKAPGADEIYSYGLRNPFRFSFDEDTKTMAIADVGQNEWEEVNYLKVRKASGANFGWDAYEGDDPLVLPAFCSSDDEQPLPDESIFPILAYPHSSDDPAQYTGCAVIGGPVVRNRNLTSLYGRYLYSDSCSGGIQSLVPGSGGATDDKASVTGAIEATSSITEGRKHRVYVTSLTGDVFRIIPTSGSASAAGEEAAPATAPRAGDGGGTYRTRRLGDFRDPVFVTGPEGAKGMRFVVEKAGRIRVIGPNGKTGTFLDIRGRVSDDGERGLLSVAFAPDYGRSGLFYVYYTDRRGDIVVSEYKRSGGNPRKAREASGRRVIRVKHRLAPNHNGGQVQFGPDGYLYLATGDGGSGGDPDENAQDLGSLLGKLLRIDPRRSGGQPYTVPNSNPFVGAPGKDEIYAYGLRNPYRFSFDSGGGRHLSIGDVGQDEWEEVNYLTPAAARGANFGWDVYEGTDRYDLQSPVPDGPVTFPIHQLSHSDGNCAITGGYVSRDPKTPSLDGRYLYADFCNGEIRSLIPAASGATDDKPVTGLENIWGIAGFGEDTKGRIYIADYGAGAVYTIARRK